MLTRKSLVSALWLTCLLTMALVAQIWASGFVGDTSRPDSFRRTLALLPNQLTPQFSAVVSTEVVLQVNALLSEEEEQEQDWADALDVPRVSFQIPSSLHNILDGQSLAPCSILSRYPLRC